MSDATAERTRLRKAIRLVVGGQLASVNMLQRRLGVTWDVADQIMATLEEHSIVGPIQTAGSRAVLAKGDQVEEILAGFPSLIGAPPPAEGGGASW